MLNIVESTRQNRKSHKTLIKVLFQRYKSNGTRPIWTIRANSAVCEKCDTPQACRANGYCALKN